MDKSKFSQSAFKNNKSVGSNAIRLCYEIRSFVLEPDSQKRQQSLVKYIDRIMQILNGKHKLSKSEGCISNISKVFRENDIIIFTLTNITIFSIDICRDLFSIFSLSLTEELAEYIIENTDTIATLLITPVSSIGLDLLCGILLREFIQNKSIIRSFLKPKVLELLVKVCCLEDVELFSDACMSFKSLLIAEEASEFINQNYDFVLQALYTLCNEGGYYVKRIALSLLYDLLKNENNGVFAERFIDNVENIKYPMNLMKCDESVEVKIEGFMLFAIVTKLISRSKHKQNILARKILRNNKEKIVHFLLKFQVYREDENFQREKRETLEILTTNF